MSNYPPIEQQIEEFGLYILEYGRVRTFCGDTRGFDKHHYILEQEYYRYPERYVGMQKIILLEHNMHLALHSAMSDARFFEKYHVERDLLLYRHRKVDAGFWDKDGNYKEDIQIIDEREI